MIRLSSSGSFNQTKGWLSRLLNGDIYSDLGRYGEMGVDALSSATPARTGKTAASWGYTVEKGRGGMTITWTNSNVNGGARIALLIQYGHGTGTGGYVTGYDYINPAARPVFDRIAQEVWEKVTRG